MPLTSSLALTFYRKAPRVKILSLQRSYALHCDFGSGLFSLPLQL